MNDDTPSSELHAWIEPEIEARVVALILGEASDFEAEELERLMEERPEIRVFKRRIEALHGLLGEAVAPVDDEDWKLAPERREELFEALELPGRTAKPAETIPLPLQESAKERRIRMAARKVLWGAAACLLLTLLLLPSVRLFSGDYAAEEKRALLVREPASLERRYSASDFDGAEVRFKNENFAFRSAEGREAGRGGRAAESRAQLEELNALLDDVDLDGEMRSGLATGGELLPPSDPKPTAPSGTMAKVIASTVPAPTAMPEPTPEPESLPEAEAPAESMFRRNSGKPIESEGLAVDYGEKDAVALESLSKNLDSNGDSGVPKFVPSEKSGEVRDGLRAQTAVTEGEPSEDPFGAGFDVGGGFGGGGGQAATPQRPGEPAIAEAKKAPQVTSGPQPRSRSTRTRRVEPPTPKSNAQFGELLTDEQAKGSEVAESGTPAPDLAKHRILDESRGREVRPGGVNAPALDASIRLEDEFSEPDPGAPAGEMRELERRRLGEREELRQQDESFKRDWGLAQQQEGQGQGDRPTNGPGAAPADRSTLSLGDGAVRGWYFDTDVDGLADSQPSQGEGQPGQAGANRAAPVEGDAKRDPKFSQESDHFSFSRQDPTAGDDGASKEQGLLGRKSEAASGERGETVIAGRGLVAEQPAEGGQDRLDRLSLNIELPSLEEARFGRDKSDARELHESLEVVEDAEKESLFGLGIEGKRLGGSIRLESLGLAQGRAPSADSPGLDDGRGRNKALAELGSTLQRNEEAAEAVEMEVLERAVGRQAAEAPAKRIDVSVADGEEEAGGLPTGGGAIEARTWDIPIAAWKKLESGQADGDGTVRALDLLTGENDFEVTLLGEPREAFYSYGIAFPEGATAVYAPSSGKMVVHNTPDNLARIDQLVQQALERVQEESAAREEFEKKAAEEPYSTFSLHVSDVSFKLAKAALEQGQWPAAEQIRVEEFVNAFDFGDPAPTQQDKVACHLEQAAHPFFQQRNLLRVSMQTAAVGRGAGTPLRLTVLLDKSGSMERVDRMESVRNAFRLLADELQPQDQVTLISFARTTRLMADRVSGAEAGRLADLVGTVPSEGGTNLEEALRMGLAKAREQLLEGGQNRVILLTDGAANLGNAKPEELSKLVEQMRQQGIAFDACGVGADGLNDEILESLTRKGDGRYYFLDRPEDADAGFAKQIAGALRPAARNVKVQVHFNPQRVGRYRLYGFEKHILKKEDFRNDSVDAAELAAEEAGNALYQVEVRPDGSGELGTVSVRFQDTSTGQMIEKTWTIPYDAQAMRLEDAPASMRLASSAALLAERLQGSVVGEAVELDRLNRLIAPLGQAFPADDRVSEFVEMSRKVRELSGE